MQSGGRRRRLRSRRQRRIVVGVVAGVVLVAGAGAAIALTRDDGEHSSAPPSSADSRTTSTAGGTSAPPTTTLPTTTTAPPGVLAGSVIHIDAGHNGGNFQRAEEINQPVDIGTQERACDTTGTATDDGFTEAEYNLDVSMRLADLLRAAGATVVMTRETNEGWGPCIDERAAIGNDAQADAAVSIHADGGPSDGRGFHLIYPPSLPGLTDDIAVESERLAMVMLMEFEAITGMPRANYIGTDGLSERTDLGGLNLSDVPKVFIETGNMRNAEDAALFGDSEFRQLEAEAIMAGLGAYLSGT